MWPFVLLAVVVVAVVASSGSGDESAEGVTTLRVGRKYHWVLRITPKLDAAQVIGVKNGLLIGGAENVIVEPTVNSTTVSYDMIARVAQSVSAAMFTVPGFSVELVSVHQV